MTTAAATMDIACLISFVLLFLGGAVGVDHAQNQVQVIKTANNDIIASVLHLPAKFGPPLPSDGLRGVVASVAPYHACEPVQPPPEDGNMTWIGIAQCCLCPFPQQVANVEKAGYSAVIIHNLPGEEKFLTMLDKSEKANVNISAVSVGHKQGRMLAEQFSYKNRDVEVEIEVASELNYILLRFILPFLLLILLPLICLFGSWIKKCCRAIVRRARDEEEAVVEEEPQRIAEQSRSDEQQRNNQQQSGEQQQQQQRSRQQPVREAWIEDEQERALSSSEKLFNAGDYQESCTICLEKFQIRERLRVLPCKHAFHPKCIDTWLRGHVALCPLCKRRVGGGSLRYCRGRAN